MFAWLILAVTILLEVVGSTMMKLSNGFSVFWPSVGVFVCYSAALAGLTITLKYIELSIAYAIWAGAGTALYRVLPRAGFSLEEREFGPRGCWCCRVTVVVSSFLDVIAFPEVID